MRRGFSLFWVVLTGVIAAVVGVLSYQAGVATQLPAGAALPPYYYEPHFYGFGLFGILFLLFIFFLLFRILSFGRWGGGHGGWKHRGYGGGVPPRSRSACRSGTSARMASSRRRRRLLTRRRRDPANSRPLP